MTTDELKQRAAEAAVEYVQDGMIVGLGTGSTATPAVRCIAERGLRVQGVATSQTTAELARSLGIPLLSLADVDRIDLTIDGADEIDTEGNLIKGGGGALLREKVIASITEQEIIVAHDAKSVPTLGAFPLPVEVAPFAMPLLVRQLAKLGCAPMLRERMGKIYITDNGNHILDCAFGRIEDPPALEDTLQHIPGVLETGLFIGLAHRVILASKTGITDREIAHPNTNP